MTAADAQEGAGGGRFALLGNPNTGKTTLFNRLTGLRHKTANFPETTLEARVGRVELPTEGATETAAIIDLPGIYSLELDQLEAEVCRAVLEGRAAPTGETVAAPTAVCVVADATNLPRNLMLVGEALRRRLPTVIAVNMIDLARKRGITVEPAALERALGCGVVCISAREGEGSRTFRQRCRELGSRTTRRRVLAKGCERGLRKSTRRFLTERWMPGRIRSQIVWTA